MTSPSWRKQSANHRDARNTPVEECPKRKHRDTKQWCRGKVGVEHTLKCCRVSENSLPDSWLFTWRVLVCTTCGKRLKHYYPIGPSVSKPDWVDC